MLTASFFCIWRQVKIKHPQSTRASPWTKSRLLLQAVILLSDALGCHLKLLRQLQQELSGTHWQYQHMIFFLLYFSLQHSHVFNDQLGIVTSVSLHFLLNALPFCHPCSSFFFFPSLVLPVQTMMLANATQMPPTDLTGVLWPTVTLLHI